MASVRTYAIGDIHGQLNMLRDAHAWIAEDVAEFGGEPEIVHVGDLVDRGPDSAGVIGLLKAGVDAGEPWVVIKGNHDRMFEFYMQHTSQRDDRLRPELEWVDPRLGGIDTLQSYGVDADVVDDVERHVLARAAVPAEHIEFVASLPLLHQSGAAVYVHAGIKPGVPIDEQVEDDLLWIRAPFHNHRKPHEALIVHGHTPVDKATHYGNRINIDTGAGYGKELSVIVVDGDEISQLGKKGRRKLHQVG